MTITLLTRALRVLLILAGLLTATSAQAQIHVSTAEAVKAALSKPKPEYSPVARQMKASGKVELEVAINTEGKVDDVKIVSGNPLLTKSAAKAAKDWTFTPFTENGQPAKAVATLSFDFKL